MIPLRLRSLLLLLAPLSACGLVRINGKPLGASDLDSASAVAPAEAGAAPELAAPPPVVDTQTRALQAGFHPNPTVIGNLGGKAEDSLFLTHKIKSGCEGYVTRRPAAVIELDQPMNLTISAPGAAVLYVRFAGKYVCDSPDTVGPTPTVTMASWPAGRVEIYAGHYNSDKEIRYAIELEDPSRKRDADWKTAGDVIALKALPAQAIVAAVAIPAAGKTPRGVIGCDRFTSHFRKDPDLAMTLARPLAGLQIATRSTTEVHLMLMGPIPDDGRNIPALCYEGGQAALGRLEAGRYAIKLATRGEAAAATVVVRGPDTPRDPLMLGAVPDKVAMDARFAVFHFPQLVEDDVWNDDGLRQKLVAAAPRPLFVFPKFDLDETTAKLELRVGVTMEVAWPEGSTWAWPRKDEPLLPFSRGMYIATDGSIYQLSAADLAPAPSGPLAIPAKARNPGLGFGYSVNAAAKEDKPRLDAYWRAANRYRACGDAAWAPYANKIAALEREAYSDARQDRIASLQQAARRKELGCGGGKLDAHRAKLWKELMASRTARRTAALAGVRKRLLALFPR